MNDWNCWLNSNETRTAIKLLNEAAESVRDDLTDGSLLVDKKNINVEYAHSMGLLEGIREAIQLIKEISSIVDERDPL